MFGLQLQRNDWILLAVAAYFVVRIGFALGQVVSRWAAPGPPPKMHMLLAVVSGVAFGAALWVAAEPLFAGQPLVARIMLRVVVGLIGSVLGFLADLMLSVRTTWLSSWLAAFHVPKYRAQLAAAEPGERFTAAKRLYELGKYAAPAIPELLVAAKDESADVRSYAFVALLSTLTDDDATMAAARSGLNDSEPRVRATAAMVLTRAEKAPPDEVLPGLCEGLMVPDEMLAGHALRAIGELGEHAAAAVPAMRAAIFDREAPLQYTVYTLQHLGPAAVPLLIEVLKRGSPADRQQAVWVLSNMGSAATEALPLLRELSKSSDLGTRSAAGVALEKLGAEKR